MVNIVRQIHAGATTVTEAGSAALAIRAALTRWADVATASAIIRVGDEIHARAITIGQTWRRTAAGAVLTDAGCTDVAAGTAVVWVSLDICADTGTAAVRLAGRTTTRTAMAGDVGILAVR